MGDVRDVHGNLVPEFVIQAIRLGGIVRVLVLPRLCLTPHTFFDCPVDVSTSRQPHAPHRHRVVDVGAPGRVDAHGPVRSHIPSHL